MKTYKQKLNEWHKKYGDLPVVIQSQIDKLVNEFEKPNSLTVSKWGNLKAIKYEEGARYIREYNGRRHEVIAQAKGFQYKNKIYKSLSAIAYEITQTKWNGKRFFGVIK